MKHIAIFNNSGDVQTALNEETLVNPYVAKVSGALDYNSLQPACYLGEWSDDGAGHYTFHINDTAATAWNNSTNIGQLVGVFFNGDQIDMGVQLQFDGYSWVTNFVPAGGGTSDGDMYSFPEGTPEAWSSNVMTDPGASGSPVSVDYSGVDSFVFAATPEYPLSMNTINPECE